MTKFDQGLECIEELIRFLYSRLGTGPNEENFGSSFSHVDFGSLSLDTEEYRAYARCVNMLRSQLKGDRLSVRIFEKALQKAILKALDAREENIETTFDEKLKSAISELRKFLLSDSKMYVCHIPISGLSVDGLPFSFGSVQIVVVNEDFERASLEKIERLEHQVILKQEFSKQLDWMSIRGGVLGVVEVRAKDYYTAESIARSDLRDALDIINFFSTSYLNQRAMAYLPGDAVAHKQFSIIFQGDSFHLGAGSGGPLLPLSLPELIADDEVRDYGFRYTRSLRESSNLTDFPKALLTAMQWAGRAQSTPRREEAFLMFVTALESIFLPEKPVPEITHRLGMYVPLIAVRGKENRLDLQKKLKSLYRTRSRIVHDGRRDVADYELRDIRWIVTQCIYRLITDEIYRDITTWADLDTALTKQAFS